MEGVNQPKHVKILEMISLHSLYLTALDFLGDERTLDADREDVACSSFVGFLDVLTTWTLTGVLVMSVNFFGFNRSC